MQVSLRCDARSIGAPAPALERYPGRVSTPPYELRRARPDDAAFLAWVVLAATRSHCPRGFFDLLVPESEAERLALIEELVLQEKPSWWHWSLFWIATRAGDPAAALAGFDPTRIASAHLSVPEALAARDVRGERLAAGFARCAPLIACFHDAAPGAWIVESVATRPEARGAGLAGALLDHVLEEGRAGGYALAQLTILIGNAPAQRVYESRGFRIGAEKRSAAFETAIGAPGLAQMNCQL
jgi:ribosomal protein S18 acetylase RimI-like enzyme